MFKFKLIRDSNGDISHVETQLEGQQLLSFSKLNKGCAFTEEERTTFKLTGLLPAQIETLEHQVERMYLQFSEHQTNLGKNIYLNVLHDYNETLFYKLVSQHLEEMLPIVYTPTVGEAVQRFSLELRKPKGLYINYQERHRIAEILENRLPPEVDLTVITDGEAVLGIGDQGVGAINISNAKLMVYTLCGGINPHRVLPIQLDVGTNNTHLLNDPMYLGWRHERIRDQEYDDFVDQVVNILIKTFPHLYIHWEDIGRDNARRLLQRHRQDMLTINGDMQATGVVALAAVLAGMHASGTPVIDHRIVILGAGTAGVGIADQIAGAFQRAGLTLEEAQSRIWLVDKNGLLLDDSHALAAFQKPYAKKIPDIAHWNVMHPSLLDTIQHVKPTVLIGCSTASGAFNDQVVKLMAEYVERPIILPLSNPTMLSEAKPMDLLHWTNGQAMIATGSPFPDVYYKDKKIRIPQSNNALAFPGIGLGVISVKAKHLSDDMLWAAAKALQECSPVHQDPFAPILPMLSEAYKVSEHIALAVAKQACDEGLATISPNTDLKQLIRTVRWEPRYYPYKK